MSDRESIQLINEHKYRHSYGLQLPDQLFCTIYYSITGRKFLSTHYYRKYHHEQTKGISLQNIKVDFTKLQQDDKTRYVLKRFSKLCEPEKMICAINIETQNNCNVFNRILFMLGLQEKNQMNLLGHILKEFSIKHLYDLNLLYRDIEHTKKYHLKQEKIKEYILATNNKLKNCVISLACWSLRRHTRSEN
eukprot:264739_1